MEQPEEKMGRFSEIGLTIEELTKMLKDGTFMSDDDINPEINNILAPFGIQIDPKIVATKDSAKIADAIIEAKGEFEARIAG